MRLLLKKDPEADPALGRVFNEIIAAIIFLMILLIFIQQLRFIQIFERRRIQSLQEYVKIEIEDSFKKEGLEKNLPSIIVDENSPLIQKILMTENVLTFKTGNVNLEQNIDQKILELVGKILLENEPIFEAVKVEGHADTIPLGLAIQNKYPTNWELSSGRAITVVRFLVEHLGFNPVKLSSVGFSSYHPIDPERLDLNRRIEFVIQYSYGEDYMYSDRADKIYKEVKQMKNSGH